MNIRTLRRGAAKLCVFFSPLPLQEPPAVTSMIPYAVFSGHFFWVEAQSPGGTYGRVEVKDWKILCKVLCFCFFDFFFSTVNLSDHFQELSAVPLCQNSQSPNQQCVAHQLIFSKRKPSFFFDCCRVQMCSHWG